MDDDNDDFGLNAYNLIQAQLQQWDNNNPSSSSPLVPGMKKSPSSTRRNNNNNNTTPGSNNGRAQTPLRTGTNAPAAAGGGGLYNQYYNDNDDDDDDDDAPMEQQQGYNLFSPSSLRYEESFHTASSKDTYATAGVNTPNQPPSRHDGRLSSFDYQTRTHHEDAGANVDGNDYNMDHDAEEIFFDDGLDSYRPYRDALWMYLQSRERVVSTTSSMRMMQIESDNDATPNMDVAAMEEEEEGNEAMLAAADEAEVKFLEHLSGICLSRSSHNNEGGQEDSSRNEGNFWDLLASLRTGGLDSLFYCVNGEEPPEVELLNDPAAMVEESPAHVLQACLYGGETKNGGGATTAATTTASSSPSLPLQRLDAALLWIESCHARRLEEALNNDYEGSNDPILPPPRRRTMWPDTLASMQRKGKGVMHPDAPLKSSFDNNNNNTTRSSSPVDVVTSCVLAPEDEVDDARLLRACFMLFQAGRGEEAIDLAKDCGQPWRAVGWTGGEALSADGMGNPRRALWKKQCRSISRKMTLANPVGANSSGSGGSSMRLYPSLAYEAGILSLLSDDIESALNNPVFRTWEDGVHAILSSERGIIEDDVLRSHNKARVDAAGGNATLFPYPGTEFGDEDDSRPLGCGADLGAALAKLDSCPIDRIRDEGGDPFRNGMSSFLLGQNALKEFIEEFAALSTQVENEDEACFLRFVTHLVLYVDTVLPDLSSQLALPADLAGEADQSISLREHLLLRYASFLSSRRNLWSHVALYTSLLSHDNIVDTYSNFLVHVHSDSERQMTLKQARQLFPKGLDCAVLRNVVRKMILCDKEAWEREAGEEPAPAGVSPADARSMRSIHWLCYYPEHKPDALVCANMLLRQLILFNESNDSDPATDMLAPKVFIDRVLPKDLVHVAVEQCKISNDGSEIFISVDQIHNLKAEFLSIQTYLKAHTKFSQFLDVISKTSPCHHAGNKSANSRQSKMETEIADKMERNAFRQRKMALCKIVIQAASRASDGLMEVLTFAGGWLADDDGNLGMAESAINEREAEVRAEEMKEIRSALLPTAVFMLHEVLDKTAMWLEQMVYDTQKQFGGSSQEILLSLFGSFDEASLSGDGTTVDVLGTSHAAPGYWHKKALSLASIVANDSHGLHETFNNDEMGEFLGLMAESHVKLNECCDDQTFYDY